MMKKLSKIALLAAALAFTAGLAGCFVSAVEDDGAGSGSTAQGGGSGTTYTLDSGALADVAANDKSDGDTTTAGTANWFTIYWSANMSVTSNAKNFNDGYKGTKRLTMSGKWTGSKQFIKFTTSKAATVKVWWIAGGANRTVDIAPYTGSTPSAVTASDGASSQQNELYISTINLTTAGTWALGSAAGGNYIYKVEVTE